MGRIFHILSNINMFKISVVLCSMLLGVILSQGHEDDGVDAIEVALTCAAGTPLEEEMIAALTNCFGGDDEDMLEMKKKGDRKGKGKGKQEQCPSADDLLAFMLDEMEGDLCAMAALGWIDEDGADTQKMKDDISSLPKEVSAKMTKEAVEECAKEMLTMWAEDDKCSGEYSEEAMAQLAEAGTMFASLKCFDQIFQQSCKDSMKGRKPQGRFFFAI